MSMNGISGGAGNPAPTPSVRDRASIDESARKAIRPSERSAADVTTARRTAGRTTEGVPAEAPPGTDPALWSVLTSTERSFFAQAQPEGPLTYGPTDRSPVSPGVALGGRLDLRV